ncbi:MAG: 2-oxoacid:acceptor oxidoreductase subunit alpha [Armatimonadota bacterium]
MGGEVRLVQGNEACADAAVAAGVRFFAGYPITPSSEIAERMALLLPRVGGKFIQMEDELGSMAAVVGASLCGVKSMTATSGPGFSLKQENIGFAILAEVPCVVVNVQRGGPSTGLPTSPSQADVMQARWGTHGDHPAISLAPSSVADMFELTVRAVNLAERFRTPVFLMADEVVAHMRERLAIPETVETVDRVKASGPPEDYLPYQPDPETLVPPAADFGEGYRFHVTGLIHDETGFPASGAQVTGPLLERLRDKVEGYRDEIIEVEGYHLDDADVGVISYGSTARVALRSVRDARRRGIRAGLLDLKTLWPFPEEQVGEVCSQADVVVVPEMNLGQMSLEVERVAHGRCEVVSYGRSTGELLKPGEILAALEAAAKPTVRLAGTK